MSVVWVAVTVVSVVSIPGISLGISSSLGISRSLTIVAVVGVAIMSTIVSSIVSKTISVSIVSVPGVSFSLGVSIRSRLSLSRSLAIVAVVRVAVVMMSKTIVASIDKIRISLWIGNCLCFGFRLAH